MKRFVVEQEGMVQLDAARRFVVEVPDYFSQEQTEALLDKVQDALPDEEEMAWSDDQDRKWIGFDVKIEATDVYDPNCIAGAPTTEGLKVIKLGDNM